MNERKKSYMKKQKQELIRLINENFHLPIFEDEIAPDEIPEDYHFFLVVYGDMTGTEVGQMYQEVFVVYLSQNNPNVEENTIDIISLVSRIPGFTFNRTVKERYQRDDTDRYFDQSTIIFRRKLMYDSGV